MAIFKMNTDSLSSASSAITSNAAKLSNVADSINGYDVTVEADDDFDFAGVKAVLAANVEACYERTINAAKLIDACAESHMNLQNELAKTPEEKAAEEKAKSEKSSSTSLTNSGTSTYNSSSYSSSSYSSSGGGSHHGGSSHSSSSHSSSSSNVSKVEKISTTPSTAAGVVAGSTAMEYLDSVISDDDLDDDLEQLDETPVVEETTDTPAEPSETKTSTQVTDNNSSNGTSSNESNSTQDSINSSNNIQTIETTETPSTIPSESSKVFMDDDFSYDGSGYAKLGNNYVVSCNESVGKVGDQITITSSTGEKVNCVIGSTNTTSSGINMYVDKGVYSSSNNTVATKFNNNIANVQNNGQSPLLSVMGGGSVTPTATPVTPTTTISDNDKLEDVIVVPAGQQGNGS